MKSVTITIEMLAERYACLGGLCMIVKTFGPKRTFRRPETLAQAILLSGELSWFENKMLTPANWSKYYHERGDIRTYYDSLGNCEDWAEYRQRCALLVATIYFTQEQPK